MKLKVKRIDPTAQMPKYAHDGDACFDIQILIDNDRNRPEIYDPISGNVSFEPSFSTPTNLNRSVFINPGRSVMFHTGLKFETERGYSMKVYIRSSTGIKKCLMLSNGTGIIDTAQYRGELMISLTNMSNESIIVSNHERVAQAEIVKTLDVEMEEVEELSETERGEGGIGSTGTY